MTPFSLLESSTICFDPHIFIFLSWSFGRSVWQLNFTSMGFSPAGENNIPFFTRSPSTVTDGNIIYVIAGYNGEFYKSEDFPSHEGILLFDPVKYTSDFIPVSNWPVVDGETFFFYPPQCVYVKKLQRIYCFGGWSRTLDKDMPTPPPHEDEDTTLLPLTKKPTIDRYHDEIFYIDIKEYSTTTLKPEPTGKNTLSSNYPTTESLLEKTSESSFDGSGENDWRLYVIISGVMGLLLLVGLVTFCAYNKIRSSSTQDFNLIKIYQEFKYGTNIEERSIPLDDEIENYCKPLQLPFPYSLQISPEQLEINKEVVLGKGAFGVVFQGMLNKEKLVAVKTLPKRAGNSELAILLSEVKILNFVGYHPNIVQLLGVQSVNLKKGTTFVIVELCSLGSLESALREWKLELELHPRNYQIAGYMTDDESTKTFSTHQLLLFSHQVCCAMEFLSSKNIVHGDLATRNVLLDANLTAKISDFGLSRHIYGYKKYALADKDTALPWRWLSPEVLRSLKFSKASDCWAFGVFMWEVFSLGDVPYPQVKWSPDFVLFLETGSRLLCPKYATDEIYELMNLCWEAEPSERPTFDTISSTLLQLMEITQVP